MDRKIDPWGRNFFLLLLASTAFYNWRGFEQYLIHANLYTLMCLTVGEESSITKHLFILYELYVNFIYLSDLLFRSIIFH